MKTILLLSHLFCLPEQSNIFKVRPQIQSYDPRDPIQIQQKRMKDISVEESSTLRAEPAPQHWAGFTLNLCINSYKAQIHSGQAPGDKSIIFTHVLWIQKIVSLCL